MIRGACINWNYDELTGTLRSEDHGHPPVVVLEMNSLRERESAGFCTEHSAKARGIGYQKETAPTLRAGVVPAVIIISSTPILSEACVQEIIRESEVSM